MRIRQLLTLSCLTILTLQLSAQTNLLEERFAFEPNLTYDSNIPSPKDHLGYELGEEFTIYAHAVDYFKTLAASSPKITINQYGETYEGRPLYNVVITSEANQQRIEEIRQNNLKLADPQSLDKEEADNLIENQPVFVSYSYNIHGNETSSTEAAMQVAYRFVAATDEATKNVLDNSVLIFYICINADGRDRYVYWYKGMRRSLPAAEPKDLEHYAPWPNGRTNHYWFDLNRDWVWGVHPESRGHTGEYIKWMPHVHTDYHEQGYNSNYFTMPGTTPRNLLLPDQYEALTDTIGKANVAAFDEHQINYFTREAFDFYYPGYGSSYPSTLGAIGMLTEQGGIGGGRVIETDDGQNLTLRQRIFDHYTTSVATIQKSVEQREMFLRYSHEAWNPKNSKSKTKAYILPDDGSGYLYDFLQVLERQGVRIDQASQSFNVADAKDYKDGRKKQKVFQKGTYIISTDQPRYLFINSIMERNMAIEDSVMYDMSTWSAPLAYNLDAYSTEGSIRTALAEVKKAPRHEGKVNNPQASYAFVVEWNQRYAPRALSMLWEKGYRVRTAIEKFGNEKKNFSPGSLIVLRGRNLEKAASIEEDMAEIAEKCKVTIDGHNTGRMSTGLDLASRKSRVIKQPKVALLVEPPFSTYTCGQIYFLFDQDTWLPVERIRTSILKQTAIPKFRLRYGGADLNDYDVLILPGGGNDLGKLFGQKELGVLKQWVSNGGVLVAQESAGNFFTKDKSKFTNVELAEVAKDTSEAAKYLRFEDREKYRGLKRIPGSALNSEIDNSNPLAFGVPKSLYSLKFGSTALKPNSSLQTVGHYSKDNLLAAGYASEENLNHLSGKAFAGVVQMGRGNVVFLLDNTQYRMFWRGPSRMMQNAVMLIGGFNN